MVDNVVYVGDQSGIFWALNASTGAVKWSHQLGDQHANSYGVIVGTADYDRVNASLYVGVGGSLYALDATTGAVKWSTDVDPDKPSSPVEVESSPVIVPLADGREIVFGSDANEANSDPTVVVALNPGTGALVWKLDLETGTVVHTLSATAAGDRAGHGCGDLWSSVAYDNIDAALVFGTGNCSNPAANAKVPSEAVWCVDAATGSPRWQFTQQGKAADLTYGQDDDFGSSAIIRHVGRKAVVLEASKAGYVYALWGATGAPAPSWTANGVQAAQTGQSGPFAGAIGGFIGGAALGQVGHADTFFGTSAVPLPLAKHAIYPSGNPPVIVDPSVANDPTRMASLHAVDAQTGKVLWHSLFALPSYAPVTFSNGVLFAPSTTGFSIAAYDAATGRPLWVAPTGGSMSGAAAIVGPNIYLGAGTAFNSEVPIGVPTTIPPQTTGILSFGLGTS